MAEIEMRPSEAVPGNKNRLSLATIEAHEAILKIPKVSQWLGVDPKTGDNASGCNMKRVRDANLGSFANHRPNECNCQALHFRNIQNRPRGVVEGEFALSPILINF